MDDATFYSKDFHRHLGRDFSVQGARAALAAGELEEWLQEYLRCEPRWENLGLADGLLLAPRTYRLLEMRVATLERKCGPEPEMEFWQDAESFERHVQAIERTLETTESLPPLVVERVAGRWMVCDGTHRLEAIRRKGWDTCWVVLFSDG
ncbi:MAG: ParB N-terminal domain-containing protein [Gemmatimonadota bacterium]